MRVGARGGCGGWGGEGGEEGGDWDGLVDLQEHAHTHTHVFISSTLCRLHCP